MAPVFDPRVFDPTSHAVEDVAAPAPKAETAPVEGGSDKTEEARRGEV